MPLHLSTPCPRWNEPRIAEQRHHRCYVCAADFQTHGVLASFSKKNRGMRNMFTLMGPNESIKSGSTSILSSNRHPATIYYNLFISGYYIVFPTPKNLRICCSIPTAKTLRHMCWDLLGWKLACSLVFNSTHLYITHYPTSHLTNPPAETLVQVIWYLSRDFDKNSANYLPYILTCYQKLLKHFLSDILIYNSCSELVLLCASMSSETWTKSGCDGNCTTTFLLLTPESMQS